MATTVPFRYNHPHVGEIVLNVTHGEGAAGNEGRGKWGVFWEAYHVNALGDDGKGPPSNLFGDVIDSHLFVQHFCSAISPGSKAGVGDGSKMGWCSGGARPWGWEDK